MRSLCLGLCQLARGYISLYSGTALNACGESLPPVAVKFAKAPRCLTFSTSIPMYITTLTFNAQLFFRTQKIRQHKLDTPGIYVLSISLRSASKLIVADTVTDRHRVRRLTHRQTLRDRPTGVNKDLTCGASTTALQFIQFGFSLPLQVSSC